MHKKNYVLYFLVQLLRGGILVSCNKENEPATEIYNISADDAILNQEICRFHDNMHNSRKSATTMELNEAIWMMEADFNYYHGFPAENYLEFETDSTIIDMPYNGFDLIPVSKLNKLYAQVNNNIVASYEKCSFENKRPYLYDLELQSTTDGLQLMIYTTIGKINSNKSKTAEINLTSGSDPFSEEDYWSIIFTGHCVGSGGSQYESAINKWHNSVADYFKPEGADWYYADLQGLSKWVYPADASSLYYGDHHCMSPSEMNQYHYGIIYVCNREIPAGRTLIYCQIAGKTESLHTGPTNYFIALWYFKHAEVRYKKTPIEPTIAALMSDPY